MSSRPFDSLVYLIAASVLVSAVLWNSLVFWRSVETFSHKQVSSSYSFREYDFPPTIIPLDKHSYNSRMIIEDTVHYALGAKGRRDWVSLFPTSLGFVRLGPENRTFGISMYHQLHCLDSLKDFIHSKPATELEKWHASHCMNYLRQMLLCAADIRLEPFHPDTIFGIDVVNGLGLEHTCRNWTALRDITEENFETWPGDEKAGWHF